MRSLTRVFMLVYSKGSGLASHPDQEASPSQSLTLSLALLAETSHYTL